LLITFVVAFIKKVNLFESFTAGIKEALSLVISLLPYLGAIFVAMELMRASGLSDMLAKAASPLFGWLGVPVEIAELVIMRPLSGSGSLAVLETIFATYGVDSYPARVASVIMGSTDTVLYVVAVYFSTSKDKRTGAAIPVALVASFLGVILSAHLCRWI
jgi:spore maturation protein B